VELRYTQLEKKLPTDVQHALYSSLQVVVGPQNSLATTYPLHFQKHTRDIETST
jgi:hypothetical protein